MGTVRDLKCLINVDCCNQVNALLLFGRRNLIKYSTETVSYTHLDVYKRQAVYPVDLGAVNEKTKVKSKQNINKGNLLN